MTRRVDALTGQVAKWEERDLDVGYDDSELRSGLEQVRVRLENVESRSEAGYDDTELREKLADLASRLEQKPSGELTRVSE